MQKLMMKLPKNIGDLTLKQAHEIIALETEIIRETENQIEKIKKQRAEALGKIAEIKMMMKMPIVSPTDMKSPAKKNIADVFGIQFNSPIIGSYKESARYPGVPCTLYLGKEKIFVIYFPQLGQISALREPLSLFTKKSKMYTVAHKSIENPNYVMDDQSSFAYSPVTDQHWEVITEKPARFHNFDIQNIEGPVRTKGQPFVFNDSRTVAKVASVASFSEISFCFDVHAQIYFLMFLAAHTPIAMKFPILPK